MKKFSFYMAFGESAGFRWDYQKNDHVRLVLWKVALFFGWIDIDVVLYNHIKLIEVHKELLEDFNESTGCIDHQPLCRDWRYNDSLRKKWRLKDGYVCPSTADEPIVGTKKPH